MHPKPEPIYLRIRDLFHAGFKIDWVTATFITVSHIVCIVGTPLAYYFAPPGLWKLMLAWTLIHAFVACLSTTVYSHRLVSHGAAKSISWPVHILFGYIGQVLAIQGSVLRWAAMHIIHHGVDRNGKHHLDPYSATWFNSGWRNFIWSHMLTYYFFHPDNEAQEQAFASKSTPLLLWQDKLYVPLLILLNFLIPMAIGFWVTQSLVGVFCMMCASIGGFILAQHNTWTVNSVTHMWGSKNGAISSAKNNYIWMGPLGEGNHHADHHDHGKDFRNGFGWSGWLLDPTRYVILFLNWIGLVKGLQRASKLQEARIHAKRAINDLKEKCGSVGWETFEERSNKVKKEWLDAVQKWEKYKSERKSLKKHLAELSRQGRAARANATEKRKELALKLQELKSEAAMARQVMREARRQFFDEISQMKMQLVSAAV